MSTAVIDEQQHSFGPAEWGLSAGLALIWGSSFLWIAIAVDHVEATVVPLARCAFGAAALVMFPSARRRLHRRDLRLLAVTSLLWMAIPFLLYPIAEQTVSSSITGMVNGGLPVVTAVVTALFTRTLPSRLRSLAVVVGAAGIALISLASLEDDAGADVRGLMLLVVALIGYAVSANIARPLQAAYGPLGSMLWITIGGTLWSMPLGVVGLARSDASWTALGALFALGFVGTGIAFAMYGLLLVKAGPVRGMIGIFFTPIVGVVLGVAFRDDVLHPLALVGMVVVLVGAVLTSRPEPARRS
ncbi:MAG: DMT family transporter [Acidimicrobiales bacterium]